MNTTIEARHDTLTKTEHKIVFYVDGVKYGFRCDEETFEALRVEEGEEIPVLPNAWHLPSLYN